ncbi:MAG: hypothetical protein ACO3QC_01340 [Phycisphaerales bacterium]
MNEPSDATEHGAEGRDAARDSDGAAEPVIVPVVAPVVVPPTTAPARADRRPQVSGPAVAATIALVLFSVFIGVFGPRLGNRQQLPAGTTLSELADAVSARHAQRVVQAVPTGAEPAFGRDEIARELEEVLGTAVAVPAVPDEGPAQIRWIGTDRVRLPGGSGVLAFLEAQRAGRRLFASVIVLRDEDRYTVFDAFGRPRPLPTGELFSVHMPGGTDSGDPDGLVQIYREGDLVFAVQSTSPDLAAEIGARFRAAAAEATRTVPLPN